MDDERRQRIIARAEAAIVSADAACADSQYWAERVAADELVRMPEPVEPRLVRKVHYAPVPPTPAAAEPDDEGFSPAQYESLVESVGFALASEREREAKAIEVAKAEVWKQAREMIEAASVENSRAAKHRATEILELRAEIERLTAAMGELAGQVNVIREMASGKVSPIMRASQ